MGHLCAPLTEPNLTPCRLARGLPPRCEFERFRSRAHCPRARTVPPARVGARCAPTPRQ